MLMWKRLRRHALWLLWWLLATALGATLIAQWHIHALRERFEADVSLAWRLLSQRAEQHETVLATLALARSGVETPRTGEQRLPGSYPHILAVYKREGDGAWIEPGLQLAEAESRRLHRAALADVSLARGRYKLVLAGEFASYALLIDLRTMVPWNDWPMAPDASPVRLTLLLGNQSAVLQPGPARDGHADWQFSYRRALSSASQPFELIAEREVGWGELPGAVMLAWALAVAILLLAARALLRVRADRVRAHELLRMGQMSRANTLGELASGMTHELQEPLSEIVINARAAQRMLESEPPELPTARDALEQVVEHAQRASNILGHLRHAVERPDVGAQTRDLDLETAARQALDLLEPELRDRAIQTELQRRGPAFQVRAQPAALEQILHNLLMNAMQALEQVPAPERRIRVELEAGDGVGQLRLQDSGPGMPNETLQRAFEPFFSTRDGALGLGLSQSESLASGMGGSLLAFNRRERGAELCLSLPLAGLR